MSNFSLKLENSEETKTKETSNLHYLGISKIQIQNRQVITRFSPHRKFGIGSKF